jgi:aspartokinase
METSLEATYDDKQCWVSLKAKNQLGLQADILNSLDLEEIPVDCIMQMGEDRDGYIDFNFTLPRTEIERGLATLKQIGEQVDIRNISNMDVVVVRLDAEGANAKSRLEATIASFSNLSVFDIDRTQGLFPTQWIARLLIKDEDFPQAVQILKESFAVQEFTRVNRFFRGARPASIRGILD